MEIVKLVFEHVGEPAIEGAIGALMMYTFVIYPKMDKKIERIEAKVDKIYEKMLE